MNKFKCLSYTIFPLVYLDNAGYRGQTPPHMPDNSLTSGELGMLFVIVIVIFAVILFKLNKRNK